MWQVHFAEGSPMIEQSPGGFGDQTNEDQLLSIESEIISFNKEKNENMGTIVITNVTTDKPLSYKIKTTSPEKFRVRPSIGILLPSKQCVVTVVLQPEYSVRGLLHNDRFLVMCLPLKNANATAQELTTLWKSEKPAEQHRLRCYDGSPENTEAQKSHSILSSATTPNNHNADILFSKINHLQECCNKLHSEFAAMKYLLFFSVIITILMAAVVVYILRSDIQNSMDNQNCHIHHAFEPSQFIRPYWPPGLTQRPHTNDRDFMRCYRRCRVDCSYVEN
ncbi:hypothetical protein KM043_017331 [Ampulex compressa]|nr:hypothetical protein KM043_017331 [Ampulex compressa]